MAFGAEDVLELVMFLFHATVIACLISQVRKSNSPFRNAFFVIYLLQGFSEMISSVWMIFLVRLASRAVLPYFFLEFFYGVTGRFINAYLFYLLFVLHSVVTFNRYAVILSVDRFKKIWTGRLLKRLILVVVIVPLPGSLNRFFCTITLKESNVTGVTSYVPVIEPEWMSKFDYVAIMVYGVGSSALSLTLGVLTFTAYKRLASAAQSSRDSDYKFVVFTAYEVTAQVVVAFYATAQSIALFTKDTALYNGVVFYTRPYAIGIFCLSSPICLLLTSYSLRRCYARMLGIRNESSTVFASTTAPSVARPNHGPNG